MTQEIDDKLIKKIKALLETRGCSEAEAQARTAKAQELLERHNLDMASLGSSGKGAQRSDTKKSGGLYSWQRKLWEGVAKLNFCYYFSLKGLKKGSVYEHRLIGSHANVIATEVMASYLQEAIEKLAQQWAKDNFYKSVFVREAIAYREGMAARIVERLERRRWEQVNEARKAEEERKREQARGASANTSHALTIVDVISSEEDFNNDYLNGWEMGTSARLRVEREARAAKWAAEHAEKQRRWDEWAAKNPEEAARLKAKADAENKAWYEKYQFKQSKAASRQRRLTPEEERMSLGSYYEGRRKGDDVGLDRQVDERATRRIA